MGNEGRSWRKGRRGKDMSPPAYFDNGPQVLSYSTVSGITKINVKKTYQFNTQCKDDVMISDI